MGSELHSMAYATSSLGCWDLQNLGVLNADMSLGTNIFFYFLYKIVHSLPFFTFLSLPKGSNKLLGFVCHKGMKRDEMK